MKEGPFQRALHHQLSVVDHPPFRQQLWARVVVQTLVAMTRWQAENYSPDFRLQILEQILEFSKICQLFESHQILAKYFCTTDLVIPKSVIGTLNRFYYKSTDFRQMQQI